MLILTNEWAPSHLDREKFIATLQAVVTARLVAKDAGNKTLATGLKVAVNLVFGKTGSAYSWLLDPTLTARVCISGELILLQAAERLVVIPDVSILTMNTDGLMVRCRRKDADAVHELRRPTVALDAFLIHPLVARQIHRVAARHVGHRAGGVGGEHLALGFRQILDRDLPRLGLLLRRVLDVGDQREGFRMYTGRSMWHRAARRADRPPTRSAQPSAGW